MKFLTFLFILFLSISAFAQEKTVDDYKTEIKNFNNKKQFSAVYDETNEQFKLGFDGFKVKSSNKQFARLFFGTTIYSKKTSNRSFIYFKSYSRNWNFVDTRKLILLADGKRIDLGDGERNAKVNSSHFSSDVLELLIYPVSLEQLKNLAIAQTVEYQLGDFKGNFEQKEITAIKDLLTLLD